jgi:DNA repair protein SbcD/Mre11
LKILHTADWHLGKYLDSYARIDEQRAVLNEICQIADSEQVDVVLVAGDLFDVFNPSNEASDLLLRTLRRLSANGTRAVVAIAGNHDSPERIDVPNSLAEGYGILFVGHHMMRFEPFELPSGIRIVQSDEGFTSLQLPNVDYPIRILHTPYVNELRLKRNLGHEDESAATLRQLLQEHWTSLAQRYCDAAGVNILLTHLYMMKENGVAPEEPESEKTIGGAQAVFTSNVPSEIQYVALGHLHRYQDLGTEQPVVYVGSPIAYSFAESNQTKYVAIIEAAPKQSVNIRKVSLQHGKPLLRERFEDIDKALLWLSENQEALVQLTLVADDYIAAQDIRRLKEAHHAIINIIPELKSNQQQGNYFHAVNLMEQALDELFTQYFSTKKGTMPNQEILDLFKEVIDLDIEDC